MSKLYQRKRVINLGGFLLALVATFPVAFALCGSDADCSALEKCGTLGCELDMGKTFGVLYKLLLPVSILVGLGLIALNGYGLMTSDGDPRKVQESKDGLFSAIMGLAFVILAMVIYRVIVTSLIPSGVDGGRIF